MSRCLTLALLLVFIACVLAQAPARQRPKKKIPEVDQRCMECICQASSNCDESLRCHNTGGGGYFCGPYVISWAYWHDGGRPGDKGRAHDFEYCLNNKTCAEQAVRGYMHKYGQDCDGSGAIDCYDFARIHKLGFSSCGGEAIYDTDYWEKLEICYSGHPYNVRAPAENNAGLPVGNNAGAPVDNTGPLSYNNNNGFPAFPGGEAVEYDYGDGGLVDARRGPN